MRIELSFFLTSRCIDLFQLYYLKEENVKKNLEAGDYVK